MKWILLKLIYLKEKREKQRLQLELEARGESEDTGSTKSSISINEPETQSELMVKLLALLSLEKIPGMMAVRKGRVSNFWLCCDLKNNVSSST